MHVTGLCNQGTKEGNFRGNVTEQISNQTIDRGTFDKMQNKE